MGYKYFDSHIIEIKEKVFELIIKPFTAEYGHYLSNGFILNRYSDERGYWMITTTVHKAKLMVDILKNNGFNAYWCLNSFKDKHQAIVKFKEVI